MIVKRSQMKHLLYFFEYCWIVNFIGYVFLSLEAFEAAGWYEPIASDEMRLGFSRCFFAIANGPLIMGLLVNKDPLIFHDLQKVSSVFIHLNPALVTYTVRWMVAPEIAILPIHILKDAEDQESVNLLTDMFVYPLILYGIWWTLYGFWLISIGHKLPDRGWGRSSFIDFTKFAEKTLNIKNRCGQIAVYLGGHAICLTITMAIPQLLYRSQVAHSIVLALLTIHSIYQGANYLHYKMDIQPYNKKKEQNKEVKVTPNTAVIPGT
jgi:hypothetical protein